jgi:hypothetical protein
MSLGLLSIDEQDLWDCDVAFYEKIAEWADRCNMLPIHAIASEAAEIIKTSLIFLDEHKSLHMEVLKDLLYFEFVTTAKEDIRPVCAFMAELFRRFANMTIGCPAEVPSFEGWIFKLKNISLFLAYPETMRLVLRDALDCLPYMWD